MRAPSLCALAAITGAACGGGTAQRAPAAKPAVDATKAESDAKGLVTEIYQSIGHGDIDGLMTLLAPPLVVFGPRRPDAMTTRTDAVVAL